MSVLTVFCCKSEDISDALFNTVNEFSKYSDSLAMLVPMKCSIIEGISNIEVFHDGNELLRYITTSAFSHVIFSKTDYYGPLYNLGEVFTNAKMYDAWHLGETEKLTDSSIWMISSACFKRLFYDNKNGFFLSDSEKANSSILCDYTKKFDAGYELLQYRPFDLIRLGLPIISKKSFRESNFDYSMGFQVQKAINYIRKYYKYDISIIIRDLLKTQNITYLYHVFHWNYVINSFEKRPDIKHKAALIVSLFYSQNLYKNLAYISNVPKEIDVFIIIKNNDIYSEIRNFLDENKYKWDVIISKENRGRDLSALLIEGRDIFNKYEYIGFCHDKRTSGGSDFDIIGDDFNDILFENIVGEGDYIRGIISLFEDNPLLGFLSPPEVMHGTYFSFLGKEWSNNYENVMALAGELDIDVPIDDKYPPYALGTAFWCRSNAIKKIVKRQWEYSDFPEEPLDLDGTLNHALERLFIFAAQDAGYYSGIIQNTEFAALYLNNLQRLLYETFNYCHKTAFFNKISELSNGKGTDLLNYCNCKDIYIFGAGGNASKVLEFLISHSINVIGFVVSDNRRKKKTLLGKPIFELSEIVRENENIKIIIAVNHKLQEEVVPIIEEVGIKDYLCI